MFSSLLQTISRVVFDQKILLLLNVINTTTKAKLK